MFKSEWDVLSYREKAAPKAVVLPYSRLRDYEPVPIPAYRPHDGDVVVTFPTAKCKACIARNTNHWPRRPQGQVVSPDLAELEYLCLACATALVDSAERDFMEGYLKAQRHFHCEKMICLGELQTTPLHRTEHVAGLRTELKDTEDTMIGLEELCRMSMKAFKDLKEEYTAARDARQKIIEKEKRIAWGRDVRE